MADVMPATYPVPASPAKPRPKLTVPRRLLSWGAPSRPVERSTVLPLPRTLRAGWRQCRCAASRTALARGALPKVGRDEGMSVPVELRDRCDLRRCRRTMVGVEQHSPLKQDAGNPEQSVSDTAQGTTIGMTARP